MMEQDVKDVFDLHIRFPRQEYDVIKTIASENQISISQLVRVAVARNLCKYLSNVRFIDKKQGEVIKTLLYDFLNETRLLRIDIKRVGSNLNQLIKIIHNKRDELKEIEQSSVRNYDMIVLKTNLMQEIKECEELAQRNKSECAQMLADFDKTIERGGRMFDGLY